MQKALQSALPGEEAQYEMAPLGRLPKDQLIAMYGEPNAGAVLVLFYPLNDEPHLLLTLRNTYDGAHSGQVSFPGGRPEINDESLQQTALRETAEETGVEPTRLTMIGELTDLYIPVSRFLVKPFVAFSETELQFSPDPREVQQIIQLPVDLLMNDSAVALSEIFLALRNEVILAPCFNFSGHIVWGATAMILNELKAVLKNLE